MFQGLAVCLQTANGPELLDGMSLKETTCLEPGQCGNATNANR